MTPFRYDTVLSPSLSGSVDEREHSLKQSVRGDTESDERDTCKQGFDSDRIFIPKDEDRHADRDDCTSDCDEE